MMQNQIQLPNTTELDGNEIILLCGFNGPVQSVQGLMIRELWRFLCGTR